MRFVVLAPLLPRKWHVFHTLTDNVQMACNLYSLASCDVTVIDILAMPYFNSTSITAGSAAEQASARKKEKYYSGA